MLKKIKNLLSRGGKTVKFKNPDDFKRPLVKSYQKKVIKTFGKGPHEVKEFGEKKLLLKISKEKTRWISRRFLEFC